jgi:hypothetical protein
MPSAAHEVLVAALGDSPELLASLLETLVGRRPGVPLTRVDSTLRFVDPEEVRPDLVLRGEDGSWLMVEVQGNPDAAKARRWLLAAAVLFNQTRLPGDLVVITSRARVTRWARSVARMRGPLGTVMQLVPVVVPLGGASLEKLLDPERPELALLAAWTVRRRRGPAAREIVRRAIQVSEKLPPALRDVQLRGILDVVDRRLWKLLEGAMGRLEEIPAPADVRRFIDLLEASRPERIARAIAPLLTVLEARGIELAPKHREVLDRFPTDEEVLEYIRRAAVANSADEVFR